MAAQPPAKRAIDRVLDAAESTLYAGVAVVLVAGALALLGQTAYRLVVDADDGVVKAVKLALESLLLVFILVELLAAIRATVRERRLVAEPFLLVGIIASIKEIVVVAIDAKSDFGARGDEFNDAIVAIAVLAGVILVLSVAILLVRLKENEPAE